MFGRRRCSWIEWTLIIVTTVAMSNNRLIGGSFVRVEWDESRRQYFLVRPDFRDGRATLAGFESAKRLSNLRGESNGSTHRSSHYFLSPYSEVTFGDRVTIEFTDASSDGVGLSPSQQYARADDSNGCSSCQLRYVANGHCDLVGRGPTVTRCNCAAWDWDGGDCCEATCQSTKQHDCASAAGDSWCRDPNVVVDGGDSGSKHSNHNHQAAHSDGGVTTIRFTPAITGINSPRRRDRMYPYDVRPGGALARFQADRRCGPDDGLDVEWDPISSTLVPCTAADDLLFFERRIAHSAFDEVQLKDVHVDDPPDVGGGLSSAQDGDATTTGTDQHEVFWVDSAVATFIGDAIVHFPPPPPPLRTKAFAGGAGGPSLLGNLFVRHIRSAHTPGSSLWSFWSVEVDLNLLHGESSVFFGISTPQTVDRLSSYQEWLVPAVTSNSHRAEWTTTGHFTHTVPWRLAATRGSSGRNAGQTSRDTDEPPTGVGATPDDDNIIAGTVHHPVFSTNVVQVSGTPTGEWDNSGDLHWAWSRHAADERQRATTGSLGVSAAQCVENTKLCGLDTLRFGVLLNTKATHMHVHFINFATQELVAMTVDAEVRAGDSGNNGDGNDDSDDDNFERNATVGDGRRSSAGEAPPGVRQSRLTTLHNNDDDNTHDDHPRLLRVGRTSYRFEPASFGVPVPPFPIVGRVMLADPPHLCSPLAGLSSNTGSQPPFADGDGVDSSSSGSGTVGRIEVGDLNRFAFGPESQSQRQRGPSPVSAASSPYYGAILLVERGRCDFLNKVMAAEAMGAVAVIVMDNVVADVLVQMKRSEENFRGTNTKIPAVFVSRMSGLDIMSQLELANTAAVRRNEGGYDLQEEAEEQAADKSDGGDEATVYASLCGGFHGRNTTSPFVDLRETGVSPLVKIAPGRADAANRDAQVVVRASLPHWPPSEAVQLELRNMGIVVAHSDDSDDGSGATDRDPLHQLQCTSLSRNEDGDDNNAPQLARDLRRCATAKSAHARK